MNETSGYIYVITNPDFEGFVKIGIAKNIKDRLSTYQTSSPRRNYKVEHKIFHPDCRQGERLAHEKLKMFALSRRNEWFEVSLHIAIGVVNDLLIDEEHPLDELFKKNLQSNV